MSAVNTILEADPFGSLFTFGLQDILQIVVASVVVATVYVIVKGTRK